MDVTLDAFKEQTFGGIFEWILVDELYDKRKEAVEKYVRENLHAVNFVDFIHIPPKMRLPERKYGYCNALNSGLLRSHGELIVFLQEYTWVPPDWLERYWQAYDAYPNRLICGLKDRFSSMPATDNLEGLISIWNNHWTGDPSSLCKLIEKDKRGKEGVLVESSPELYDLDDASMPYALVCALNGVDERYGDGMSQISLNISHRATGLGYMTVIDMRNIAREFNIYEYFPIDNAPIPDPNFELHKQTMMAIQRGEYSLRALNGFSLGAR